MTICADAAPCRPGPLTRRRSAAPLAPRAPRLRPPHLKFIRAIRAIRGQPEPFPRGAGVPDCQLPHRPGASSAFPRPQTPDPRPFLAQSLKLTSLSGFLCVSVPQWLIYFASSRLCAFALSPASPFGPAPRASCPAPLRLHPATSGYIRLHPATSGYIRPIKKIKKYE